MSIQENGNRDRSIGGIGAGLVEAFVKEGYNVVAMSRNFNQSLIPSLTIASPSLMLVRRQNCRSCDQALRNHRCSGE
jgi:NAD(P)-dependent dehydrogenase (short-subunit alcohol dehydrogenase family)